MLHALKSLVALGILLAAGNAARAQEIAIFGQPTSPYQAERTFTTEGTTLTQRVYSSPGKTRTEMSVDGMQIIQIWRTDRNLIWSLMPRERMAIELAPGSDQVTSPLDPYSNESDLRFEKRLMGPDTVNGISANRYFISGTASDGSKTEGDVWTTPQNITVRMRLTGRAPGEADRNFNYDLADLVLRDQHESLFEVPSDYQVMTMGMGYPGMTGQLPGAEDAEGNPVGDYAGDVARDAAGEAVREADRQVRRKAGDEARKAVRKILPW